MHFLSCMIGPGSLVPRSSGGIISAQQPPAYRILPCPVPRDDQNNLSAMARRHHLVVLGRVHQTRPVCENIRLGVLDLHHILGLMSTCKRVVI